MQRKRYHDHIQRRHPGVDIDSIQIAVEAPDLITEDKDSIHVNIYYAEGILQGDPLAYLKVCVLFRKEGRGLVITAYEEDEIDEEEEILWQK